MVLVASDLSFQSTDLKYAQKINLKITDPNDEDEDDEDEDEDDEDEDRRMTWAAMTPWLTHQFQLISDFIMLTRSLVFEHAEQAPSTGV